jgi:hypothetical protein
MRGHMAAGQLGNMQKVNLGRCVALPDTFIQHTSSDLQVSLDCIQVAASLERMRGLQHY